MDGQAADHQRILAVLRPQTAQHRADARHHLARREGFDDIIIRADVQAEDAVGVLVSGSNHQDGRGAHLPDAAAYLQPVDARQHDIQQDNGGFGGVEQAQRFFARAGGQHGPVFRFDVFGQNFKDLLVVVYHENGIHGKSLPFICKMLSLL